MELVEQYAALRRDMDSGPSRTRRLEMVASRTRGLAADLYPPLPRFTASASAGERLAAITFL